MNVFFSVPGYCSDPLCRKIFEYTNEAYNIQNSAREVNPSWTFEICVKGNPCEDGVPACTVTKEGSREYKIWYNPKTIAEEFAGYERLICFHEMAHIFCDELTIIDNVDQPSSDNFGHPVLFFDLMKNYDLTPAERRMQHIRHEIPYNYGRPWMPWKKD